MEKELTVLNQQANVAKILSGCPFHTTFNTRWITATTP
ncbi:hypothetical protein ADIMK_0434 [Marinobacterium lacunae]|uniref:Uncharacterized protein n=1 Tax=Marinobacterium lacunae TaxID=1232683 RepID=A0A081G3X2_9GAMM|nr:hypothetical protein ADIMK_0434 [Marinobacterium lacunae]